MRFALVAVIGAACLLGTCCARDLHHTGLQIVGGHPVKIEEVPFQVSLEQYGEHQCGGSILSKQWVLTAAHCIYGIDDPTIYGVRYATDVKEQGGTLVGVRWLALHDQYVNERRQHDVAVVQVDEDIVFSPKAQPIRMTVVGTLPKSTDTLSVSGWGTDSYYDWDGPSDLRAVSLPYVPRSTCRISYEDRGRVIDESMICAGMSGKDSCWGDVGGPLVNGLGVQVGVVSWGVGCGSDGYAGVYADLGSSINRAWIQNKTGIA
uniref:Serine protease n=1 Tax=Frankliniella occidentalis TaxID=133901 RepID=A0A8F9RZL8_FRAOC|nr:serine protease [Frankliniella occidentalis]